MERRGQAMIETVIAVVIISSIFFGLFKLSQMFTGKILLEHAAMRVARARAVGFNDSVCLRAAKVAVIPAAGKRAWPEEKLTDAQELARVAIYLGAVDEGIARRVLDYKYWDKLRVKAVDGGDSSVGLRTDWFDLEGNAEMVRHSSLYLNEAQ